VASAKDIDRSIYQSRESKDYLNPETERPECEKFRIRDTYGMEVTPELVKLDDNSRLIGRLIALEGILAEPGEIVTDEKGRIFTTPPALVRDRDLNEREWLQICTDWRNESTAWFVLYELGLRDILLMLMQGQELSADDPIMQELLGKALKYAASIKAILNTTIPPDASATWVLGILLNRLALSTICTRKRIEGKSKRFYSLKPEDLAFALHVLAYRQQQREEKERKRQEQQERNAAHAAWIQSQYGDKPKPQAQTETAVATVAAVEVEVEREASEDVKFCLESLQKLESSPDAIASEDELITLFQQIESASVRCSERLPEVFWERVSAAVGVCSDALAQREARLESVVNLLKEAISHGAETIYCILKRWNLEQRWEAILRLEKVSSEAMDRLVQVAPDWSVAML
jgi:hypothetical protein